MKSSVNTLCNPINQVILISLFFTLGCLEPCQLQAQDTQYIKIKAFDEALSPYPNIKVAINQGNFITLNEQGTAFTNLKEKDFPIKSIDIGDDMLEAASWNLSKGVLEITIRKKSYRDVTVVFKNLENEVVGRQPFTFKGAKTVNSTTNPDGSVSLPLALNERITEASQFTIKNYKPVSISANGSQYVLKVDEQIKDSRALSNDQPRNEGSTEEALAAGGNEIYLNIDSIQTLPELYALLKGVKLNELSVEQRNKVDMKFDVLLTALSNGQEPDSTSYIKNINDSTVVESDLRNLLKEVRRESQRLNFQKAEFDSKINLIRDKLNQGFENLNEDARSELLRDLNLLEELLASNKAEFIENQSVYLDMIADIKDRFFDIEKLEGQLSASEQKRREEKKLYQQRILAISGAVVLFALMTVVLLYLRKKLKKKQKELTLANAEIINMNQNLEALVAQRTRLLEKTYKELDMVLYRASHDLRGPICSITGLSNLIALKSDDDELTDLILKTNNKMDRLLKKLSTISEIHQPGTLSEVYVFNLVEDVLERFENTRKSQGTDLNVVCDNDLKITSVYYLLDVVIHSLVENALYYSGIKRGQNGKVSLKVEKKGDQLMIEVYDNGIGIDKSSVDQLFDMFYIGSEFSKGNGLGLYIVKKSVDLLSGKISVESELGEFTRIIVSVPLDESKKSVPLDFLSKKPAVN